MKAAIAAGLGAFVGSLGAVVLPGLIGSGLSLRNL